ncbi:MAG: hypothetical protein WB500_06725 [Rhodoplanes sp.]
MLLTFRLFVFAAGLVIVALAVTTRGLVPEPEARTRIGEVPSVGRSLVQQAIIPPALIERRSVDAEIGPVGELRGTRDSSGPAAEDALIIGSAVGGIAQAPPATEQMLEREAPGSAQAAPATAPTEPVRDDATAPARSASGAIESLFVAPSLPSLAALRPSASPDLDELAEALNPAEAPAMAFGVEPETGRTGKTPAHTVRDLDRLSSLPADATASDRPSKKTKNVRASKRRVTAQHVKRSTADKSERKVAKRTRKKVKVSRRATPATPEAVAPATGATYVVQGVPQTYQYLYAVPLRPHVVAPGWTSVR